MHTHTCICIMYTLGIDIIYYIHTYVNVYTVYTWNLNLPAIIPSRPFRCCFVLRVEAILLAAVPAASHTIPGDGRGFQAEQRPGQLAFHGSWQWQKGNGEPRIQMVESKHVKSYV